MSQWIGTKSLRAQGVPGLDPAEQLRRLATDSTGEPWPSFAEALRETSGESMRASHWEILQVNVGYACNQVCAHCHVDAGPDRKERMDAQHFEWVRQALATGSFRTLDITGGAPELHPDFRPWVESIRMTAPVDLEIIVRSNLTIIESHPRFHDLPEWFASQRIRVVSSLPHHTADRTDRQRGEGVFDASIRALRRLHAVGYGVPESGLTLDLVYNPSGAFLPGPTADLETGFRRALGERGLAFNRLLTINNMPIARFLDYLWKSENYDAYMERLIGAFNPRAVSGLMCRNTLSVGHDGTLYDCDFNQMLHMSVAGPIRTLGDWLHATEAQRDAMRNRPVVVANHCYGCTAGAGSSCQGALA